jgi:hypothetical protein
MDREGVSERQARFIAEIELGMTAGDESPMGERPNRGAPGSDLKPYRVECNFTVAVADIDDLERRHERLIDVATALGFNFDS